MILKIKEGDKQFSLFNNVTRLPMEIYAFFKASSASTYSKP